MGSFQPPKISIVTPSFNQGQYIEQTICSVLDQQYPNLEFLIIDGGSTDNTVEVIKKYEKYISYWESIPDRGQTHAINKGYSRCTGEVFNWLNSDDYYNEGALAEVGDFFGRNNGLEVLCGLENGFYHENPELIIPHPGSIIAKTVEETIFTAIIDQPCTFFRKSVIDPFFPLNESLRYVMDRELWIKYLASRGVKNIQRTNQILTWFRIHADSKSGSEIDKFEPEVQLLHSRLIKQIGGPDWLCPVAETIQNQGTQLIDAEVSFNKKELLKLYIKQFITRNYIIKDLAKVRQAALYKWSRYGWRLSDLKLLIKAFLIPQSVIEWVKGRV